MPCPRNDVGEKRRQYKIPSSRKKWLKRPFLPARQNFILPPFRARDGTRWCSLTVMVVWPLPSPLHRCMDNAWGLLSSYYLPVTVFHTPAADLSSAFERSNVLNISNVRVLLLPPQSPKGGCLVTSRCCLPSTADEEWYSPKRPSSTVVESKGSLTTRR